MKLTQDSINLINLFERITKARVKDCIIEEKKLIFIVNEEDISRAIGKNGNNVKRIINLAKKDVQVVAYNDDVTKLILNLIYPNKVDNIKLDNKIVSINVSDSMTKGRIFGRDRENLKRVANISKRYFDIEDIKVS